MLLGPQDIVWSIGQAGGYNSRVQRWLEYFTTVDCSVEYQQGNAFSLSHSPETAKDQDDRAGSAVSTSWVCSLRARYPPTRRVG